jgi:hypothetical protein
MTIRHRAVVALWALAPVLAACAADTPSTHADRVTEQACRQRAEQIYALRNPEAPYQQDNYVSSTRDAPFATSGVTGVTTQGLGSRYELEKMVSDCIGGTSGGQIGPTPAAPPTSGQTP